jgi:hypothetical protein
MGIHPGLSGMDAIPFLDLIDTSEVDILLISQYVTAALLLPSLRYTPDFC